MFRMHLRQPRIPLFRIFYSSTFTILVLVLTALLLITPGDHVLQSLHANRHIRIIIVASVLFLTLVVAVFIYAGRLFATRKALANIPKKWYPAGTGKGDLGVGLGMGHRVGKMVREGLDRSAVISFEGMPRDLSGEEGLKHVPIINKKKRKSTTSRNSRDDEAIETEEEPVWGIISHPGWSSPSSPDFPHLQFEPVILELGPLIEAKAVSLVPPDPLWTPPPNPSNDQQNPDGEDEQETPGPPPPDPLVVELIQRPATMGLRAYLTHLTTLTMLPETQTPTTTTFLALYEHARFSDVPLPEPAFRTLTTLFATLLQSMLPPPQTLIDSLRAAASSPEPSFTTTKSGTATPSTVQHHHHHAHPATTTDPEEEDEEEIYHSASSSASAPASIYSLASHDQGTLHTAPSRHSRHSRQYHHQPPARGPSRTSTSYANSAAEAQREVVGPYRAGERMGSEASFGSGESVIRVLGRGGGLELPVVFLKGRGGEGG